MLKKNYKLLFFCFLSFSIFFVTQKIYTQELNKIILGNGWNRLCPIIPVKMDDLVYNIKVSNFKKYTEEATLYG